MVLNEVTGNRQPATESAPPTGGTAIIWVLRAIDTLLAVTFLLAAALHVGAEITVGGLVLAEPRILPATIAEGSIGLLLALSAYGLFTRKTWAWEMATLAHTFAVVGLLVGIFALARGAAPTTDLNHVYHLVALVVLVAGLALLWTPAARAALR